MHNKNKKDIGIKSRFYFLIWLMEYGESFQSALVKSEMTLGECIYAHDVILSPQNRIQTITRGKSKRGNKQYRYKGKGQFRRIDRLGREIIDGRSKVVDGAVKLGFVDNPLRYALDGKGKK